MINNPETLVYDVLAQGKKTTNIKRGLLHSILVIEVFRNMPITIKELEQIIKQKYNIRTDSLNLEINELKRQKRIIGAPLNKSLLSLTDAEATQLKPIIDKSQEEKKDFDNAFNQLLSKYSISPDVALREDLINLYRAQYQTDINNQNATSEIKRFRSSLSQYVSAENMDPFIMELKSVCSTYSYINKSAVASSFLNFYDHENLNKFISDKTRIVFLDTPVIVYMLCYLSGLYENAIEDWNDPYYIAAKSLYKIKDNVKDKVRFCVMRRGYVKEVAGELRKAFMIDKVYRACGGRNFIGETSNTFYNYYMYIRNQMSDDCTLKSFKDFAETFNVKIIEPENVDFIDKQYWKLKRNLEFAKIQIIDEQNPTIINKLDKAYIKILLDGNTHKVKSETPRKNDEIQVEYCANDSNFNMGENPDRSIATWDFSLAALRNWLLDEYGTNDNMSFFYVHNPAKQVNAIALASFQINSTCITNDIFNYADENFALSHKMKVCIEDLHPLIGYESEHNMAFLRRLEKLQANELGNYDENDTKRESDKYPLGEVLKEIVDAFQQPMLATWKKYIEESENIQPLIDILSKAMENKLNNCEYDFVGQIKILLNTFEKG